MSSYKSYIPLIIIGILVLALFLGVVFVLVFGLQTPLSQTFDTSNMKPTVNILLYVGEMNGQSGFGYTTTALTSPGPTLRFKISDIVNITVVNVGDRAYAFALTDVPHTGASVLFRAEIGSINNPIQPGQTGSVIFKPYYASRTFFYTSPLSGDAEIGLYGSVLIGG
ncbi:MAG TPA: multicopper oxidase domain-containing protein [Candidatus Sulfotelmatobacter sp.]|nr:multicopper oxidase domain-containing protein [Candidatus Sulfotelmatobacter sp.]